MKKQNMFKAILFTILAVLVLTWLIPTGTASGTEVITQGLQRIGLYDILEYPIISFEFFANVLLLIFGVGAFYGVLSKSSSYSAGVSRFARSLRGSETAFLVGVTIFFALLTSVCGFNTMAFMIIPFFITVLLTMGYDKMTAFLATFGSTLVATIGSVWNQSLNGYINGYLSIDYSANLIAKIALLVVPMVIYVFFVTKYAASAHRKGSKKDASENKDVFELAEKKKSGSTAVMVLMGVLFVILILAITPWETVFGLEIFSKATEAILGFELFGHQVFSYILGGIPAFGEYLTEESLVFLAIAAIVIALVSKMSYQDIIEGAKDGIAKVSHVAIAVAIAHSVLALVIYYPIYPTIEGWLINLVPEFNIFAVFTSSINMVVASVLNVDPMYISQQALPMMATAYASNTEYIALIAQSMYGLTSLVAPTSIMLVIGLEYLDIPYTTWIKTAWKTILEIAVIVVVLLVALFFIA